MSSSLFTRHGGLALALAAIGSFSWAAAQDYGNGQRPGTSVYGGQSRPEYGPQRAAPVPKVAPLSPGGPSYGQVAQRPAPAKVASRPDLSARKPNEHPLMPALRWAHSGLGELERIQDYSGIMVKRERINGKLQEQEYLYAKVRHRPLSVYLRFLKPESHAGREVVWIEGQNNGKMCAHGVGVEKVFGTLNLDPAGPIAMRGNRYPITEIGILNMVRRLIEIGERDTQYGECEVKFFEGAKINGRTCTCIQVVHPKPRREFLFHVARIFVDDELNLPIRYEAYDWPSRAGGSPELTEEYTYLDLQLNNGFTDADFDINNPNYQFKRG